MRKAELDEKKNQVQTSSGALAGASWPCLLLLLAAGLPGFHQGLESLPERGQPGAQHAPTPVLFAAVPIHVAHAGPRSLWGHAPFGVVLRSAERGAGWPRESCLSYVQNLLGPRAVGGQDAGRILPELDLQVATKGCRQPAGVQVIPEPAGFGKTLEGGPCL